MRYLPVFLAAVSMAFATDICTVSGVGSGICISTSECSSNGGSSHAGYCAGSSDIQCCTGIPCKSTGICMRSSECTGTTVTGACPGPNGFSCCTNIPCDGNKGTCMPKSSCTKGTPKSGMCPGPSNYICCSGSKPPGPTPGGKGDKIAKAAEGMVGKYPYSWGGGDENGATYGIKQDISPYCDDRHVIGFDCSGLALYSVYQGTGKSLDHYAQSQYDDGPKYPLSQRQPGDLVFFGSSSSTIHHVAIYVGNNQMVEAPGHNSDCSGIYVRKKELRTSDIIQKVARYW